MNKKWTEDYSSEEDSCDEGEDIEIQVDEIVNNSKESANSETKLTKEQDQKQQLVQIHDINYGATRTEIGRYLEDAGCKIAMIDLLLSNGRSRGIAIVDFVDISSLNICLGLHGKNFQGRNLKVSLFSGEIGNVSSERPKNHNSNNTRKPKNGNSKREKVASGMIQEEKRATVKNNADQASPDIQVTRPKLVLKPRTIPIEKSVVTSNQTIFGLGKAQDELAYSELKKKTSSSKTIHGEGKRRDEKTDVNPDLPIDNDDLRSSTKQDVQEAVAVSNIVPDKAVNNSRKNKNKISSEKKPFDKKEKAKDNIEGKVKPVSKAPANVGLTDEEKFLRAQDNIKKFNSKGRVISSGVVGTGGFGALNLDDGSENSD